MSTAISIRTCDRRPHRNFLRATVSQLISQGVEPTSIHVAATSPDVAWLDAELNGLPVHLDIPQQKRTPNENALASIQCVDPHGVDWLAILEDDIVCCDDFLGSIERWLQRFARDDRHVFKFFDLAAPPSKAKSAYDFPLMRMRSSQAIVLRMNDAVSLLNWGQQHIRDWPLCTAWGRKHIDDSHRGWDKVVASWALIHWPNQPGVMSHPHFVKHVGTTSSIHQRTAAADRYFGGSSWSFR